MPDECGRTFDESLLSGYVDRALVQSEDQRVRIHLEDCATCRSLVEELQALRGVSMSTSFKAPEDLQWSERPRSTASRASFRVGWLLTAIWIVAIAGQVAWSAWQAPLPTAGEFLAFAGVLGLVLLFVGVLLDRITASRTDRYKEVDK